VTPLFRFMLRWSSAIVLTVVILRLLFWVVWQVPERQVDPLRQSVPPQDVAKLVNDQRRTLLQALGGLALLGGLYFTLRRIKAAEIQAQAAQEGQVTDRFTRAIEQIGSEKLEVRLGGIYALERIARDSPEDHWAIMEVLTCFVREKAHWDLSSPYDERNLPKSGQLPADIQAILTVIGRRGQRQRKTEPRPLDLTRAFLFRADLRQANLEKAILHSCCLAEADLWHACLNGANLWHADLGGARLQFARMLGAYLAHANLRGADLTGALGLTSDQLKDARGKELCRLPEYLQESGTQE
jgi:hypothetical protein